MAEFLPAYERTFKNEGWYSNDPRDPGAETVRGVARSRHPKWKGWPIVDTCRAHPDFPSNLSQLPELAQLVEQFYSDRFWEPLLCQSIGDQETAEKLFDCAVNQGLAYATSHMQRALNILNDGEELWSDLVVDGEIGPRTLATIEVARMKKRLPDALLWFVVFQGSRYAEIAESNRRMERFARGWVRRAFQL